MDLKLRGTGCDRDVVRWSEFQCLRQNLADGSSGQLLGNGQHLVFENRVCLKVIGRLREN